MSADSFRISHTFNSLIPKVNDPSKMKDLCPSLCNVLYKVVLMVLMNWLKKILGKLVAPSSNGARKFFSRGSKNVRGIFCVYIHVGKFLQKIVKGT